VIDDAPASKDIAVVELRSRQLLSARVVRYRVRLLTGADAGPGLARFASGTDARTQRSFGRASLFVDPSATGVKLNLTISPLLAGQTMALFFDGPGQVAPVTSAGLGGAGFVLIARNAYTLTTGQSGLPTTNGSVSPGSLVSPITGTAQLPDGVSVVVTVTVGAESGPPQTLTSGPFTLPIPQ
jgi:hypothetical protein